MTHEEITQRDHKLINAVFLFTYNFPHTFIEDIWNGNNAWLADHLRTKFHAMVGDKGFASAGDICNFYTQLDAENRARFAEYIIKYAKLNNDIS